MRLLAAGIISIFLMSSAIAGEVMDGERLGDVCSNQFMEILAV